MAVKLSLVGLALILAACGSVATVQPSPTQNPAVLNCRLPIALTMNNGGKNPAFIQFPQATLTAATIPSFVGTQLRGYGAPAYDQPLATWLPVPPAYVSPDGARYAYTDADWTAGIPTSTRVHVVDVRSGRDRVVFDKGAYDVVAFTATGVFVVHHLPQTDSSDGLWLLNPDTGTLRKLTSAGTEWFTVGADAAWSGELVPGDTTPGKIQADRLIRLDLQTGAVTPWFYRPNQQIAVLGLDSEGRPLIEVGSETKTELWLVTAPSAATLINSGGGWGAADSLGPYWPVVADSHGVWMNTTKGIALYRPGGRSVELLFPSQPGAASGTVISGGCR
jgi:hypothetical protein